VAPTASVIGDVSLGAGSSVWYGAKVRGDVHTIKIGANSSIGDCSMVQDEDSLALSLSLSILFFFSLSFVDIDL